MKISKLITAVLFFLFLAAEIFAQSAFTDAGTISKTDPRFTEITFSGLIQDSSSLETNAMEFTGAGGVVQLSYYFTASDTDSIDVSFVIKGTDHSGRSADLSTLVSSDTTVNYKVVVDTIDARWLKEYKLGINSDAGDKGNDSTFFYGTLKIIK